MNTVAHRTTYRKMRFTVISTRSKSSKRSIIRPYRSAGLVDDLVRRDLHKFGARRESSFIYHRAKRLILPHRQRPP